MAPEQARGRAVDKRADIWAFGVVLFEMLAGRHLFAAEDVSETLAAVLTRDLSLTALPAPTPPRVRRLLARCLDRDPRIRLRDIGEARVEIDKAIAGADESAVASPSTASATSVARRGRLAWIAFAVAQRAGTDLWALPLDGDKRRFPVLQSAFDEMDAQFSPDGRWIAHESNQSGRSEIVVRPFPQSRGQWQVSTSGGSQPRWRAEDKPRQWSDKPLADIVAAGIPTFDLAPDGKRVAALRPVETPGQSHVTFLLNCGDELQRKMPVGK